MAATHNQSQVFWSAAATQSINAGANATSDAVTFNTADVDGMISVKADNNGTPAAGDTVDVYILYSNGDPDADADSADEWDTVNEPIWLCNLNTLLADPQIKTVPISVAAKSFKLYAVNNSGGRAITVSAQMTTVRV
jgi:hypothetical protein